MARGQFALTVEKACALHAAEAEALEWGVFRRGSVFIAGTDYLPPPAVELPQRFAELIAELDAIPDIYDQAIHIFLGSVATNC